MNWIKFGNKYPQKQSDILYYNGICIMKGYFTDINKTNEFYPNSYDCHNEECDYIPDDCRCPIIINYEHFWMELPEIPK